MSQDKPTFTCLVCGAVGIGEAPVLTEAGWRAKIVNSKWGDICPECRKNDESGSVITRDQEDFDREWNGTD